MPTLHFATPPTRETLRHPTTPNRSPTLERQSPDQEMPLKFEKRPTQSPSPSRSSRPLPSVAPKSLLSSALAATSSQGSDHVSLHPTSTCGILKKQPLSPVSNARAHDLSDPALHHQPSASAAPVVKPKFVEPIKPSRHKSPSPLTRSRSLATAPSQDASDLISEPEHQHVAVNEHKEATTSSPLTAERLAILETESPVLTRRRGLVFQESSLLLERAAVRAARLSSKDGAHDGQQLPSAQRDYARRRGSHHSTSSAASAGEESSSTRSSWVTRTNSRTSSLGTSPSATSIHDADSMPKDDDAQDSDQGAQVSSINVGPITPLATLNDVNPFDQIAVPSQTPILTKDQDQEGQARMVVESPEPVPDRKLKFAQSPEELIERDARRASTSKLLQIAREEVLSSTPQAKAHTMRKQGDDAPTAVGGAPVSTVPPSGKRSLSFTVCPHPQRDEAKLRSSRPKLSASPAPQALSYKQRLRAMRGGPIRSPAPSKPKMRSFRPSPAPHPKAGSASGYSEDEEDSSGEDTEDDEDQTGSSFANGSSSLATGSEEDGDEDDDDSEAAHLRAVQGRQEEGKDSQGSDGSDDDPELEKQGIVRRPAGTGSNTSVGTSLKGDHRPSVRDRRSRSAGAAATLLSPRLLEKDSRTFSHPICFLPDTFEDSAPPSPLLSGDDYTSPGQGWPGSGRASEVESGPNSRRCSFQNVPNQSGALPISLPFHRGRDRSRVANAASAGVSDSEHHAGPNAGWRAPSWMQHQHQHSHSHTHLYPSHAMRRHTPIGSPKASDSEAMPLSTSLSALHCRTSAHPSRPVNMRFSSSRGTADSVGPSWSPSRRSSSVARSHVGKPSGLSTLTQASTSLSAAVASCSPPSRPGAGQRSASSVNAIRCRPSVAECSNTLVSGATSPPRETAWHQLQHCLASPPPGEGSRLASGATTPGSGSYRQEVGAAISRYWTDTLTSLAQAMTDELAHAGNAVFGRDAQGQSQPQHQPHDEGFGRHDRANSVALEAQAESGMRAEPEQQERVSLDETQPPCRPQPIRIASPRASAWNSDRDGEGIAHRARTTGKKKTRKADKSAGHSHGSSPTQLVRVEREEDGHTCLVAVPRGHEELDSSARG